MDTMKIQSKPFLIFSLLLALLISGPHGQDSQILGMSQSRYEYEQRPLNVQTDLLASYPSDPTADIHWSAGYNGVADIQTAFNNARATENAQLGRSIPMLNLPTQATWNQMSDGDKALWLINRERLDRGVLPLDGLEANVSSVAQTYADYLLDNNTWGHDADGYSPWERLENNPAIGACHDFLSISENLAVFVTSGSSIALPVEQAIFNWMYEDGGCCGWGHRHTILWNSYTDNSGAAGKEGFLGFGRANGGPYKGPFSSSWNFAEMLVMNVFDPCSSWSGPAPFVRSITLADSSPTSANTIKFNVTFSKPVSGVDKNDFTLSNTGAISAALVTTVSGSSDRYTVTASTGTGNGTIRLDVKNSGTGIQDLAGIPLDGGFNTGEVYYIVKSTGQNGPDTTGVFRPGNGALYLKNSNTTGFADIAINFGLGGDYPVTGDWDGNGSDTIGVYRSGTFYLRNSNTIGYADIVFPFGAPGDQPIAGDWNGDGIDTIGVYRPSTGQFLLRNSNSAGSPQMSFYLGNVNDVGIAGDWNGDGIDTTGVFRPSNGVIFLKNSNSTGYADIALNYGLPGDKPVMGDWNNDGIDTIGIYRNGVLYLRNSNTIGFADLTFALGNPGDIPIAGNWDGIP